MSYAAPATRLAGSAARLGGRDGWYGYLLYFLLAGYAIFGKGFAYIGVPPLYIGEIALLLGIFVLVRSGCEIAVVGSLPGVLLLVLITLVIVRTVPYIRTYGINAARDSVLVLYGLFAFIVAAWLLEDPGRLTRVIAVYSRFAWFYGLVAILVVNSSSVLGAAMPNWPGGGVPIIYVRLGECASHLAGAAVFALLGFRRAGPLWVIILLCDIGMVSVSRGAMLASMVPIAFGAILSRQKKRFGSVLLLASVLFALTYAAGFNIPLPGGRSIGPEQITNGFESIVGTSDEANLDGTKEWRLHWWDAIVDYTFHGPYFWTGKGFGVNLAVADGFVVGQELRGPPVRSPHSAHMTMLARTGVPGLFLWIATGVSWFAMLFRWMIVARRRGDDRWADVFVWIGCYGAAMIIDGSFDVALEGPMIGIWFWCVFGFGIAATMIYRAAINADRVVSQRPAYIASFAQAPRPVPHRGR